MFANVTTGVSGTATATRTSAKVPALFAAALGVFLIWGVGFALHEEAKHDPALVRDAPHRTRVGRLDETRAARRPVLRWRPSAANATD